MGWPAGKPRGPQSAQHKARLAASQVRAQQKRYEDPAVSRQLSLAIQQSWDGGALAARRYRWTEERDAALRDWCATAQYREVRRQAPAALGASEGVLLRRMRELGLSCWRPSRRGEPSPRQQRLAVLRDVYRLEPDEPAAMGTPEGLRARARALRQEAELLMRSATEMEFLAGAGGL